MRQIILKIYVDSRLSIIIHTTATICRILYLYNSSKENVRKVLFQFSLDSKLAYNAIMFVDRKDL